MDITVACDFFVVPTLTFKRLFCFVLLSHDGREIGIQGVPIAPRSPWQNRFCERVIGTIRRDGMREPQ